MSLTEFDAIVQANFTEPDEVAHLVATPPGDPGFIWRAVMKGYEVRADCGYVWVPTDPEPHGYPRCPKCFGGAS